MSDPIASLDEMGSQSPAPGSPASGSHRRRSKYRRKDHSTGFLIWLAVAAVFALFAYIQIKKEYFAKLYNGEIDSKMQRLESRRRSRILVDVYYIRYAYVADDGRRYVESVKTDQATYEHLRPGQPVPVRAAKILGTYSSSLYTTDSQPPRKLIAFLVTASATCLSVSLLFLLATVCPSRREKIINSDQPQQRAAVSVEALGRVSREVLQPLPRRVRFRGKDRTFEWHELFLPLPFLLIGAYLVLIAVWLGMARTAGSIVGCVVVSIVAVGWNALWLTVLCGLVKDRWVIRRLCRWGNAVEGTIVKRLQKDGKPPDYYLECQYTHPGLGPRTIKLPVKRHEHDSSNEGRRVTVLCYPNRRWPTQVYEIGNIFRCY